MDKQVIAVIFGGQSSEHEVSCMSVQTIIKSVDADRYELLLIGITREGRWLLVESPEQIASDSWRDSEVQAVISPDRGDHGVLLIGPDGVRKQRVDVAFPVLHGLYGEDGTIQGVLELAGIPYVGCGLLASAVSMDKFYTKVLVNAIGIRQAAWLPVYREQLEDMEAVRARVEEAFPYPVFVKPSRAGSSCGVSRACGREELERALREAARFDRKILVEEAITGREVECAVLGGYETRASGIGEILAAAEFYDYESKYQNEDSRTVVDPDVDPAIVEKIRECALEIFRAVDGFGLSRVDFFVTEDGEVVFNEINTLPGFTSISMYPMLWEHRGISPRQLVQQLIDQAFER